MPNIVVCPDVQIKMIDDTCLPCGKRTREGYRTQLDPSGQTCEPVCPEGKTPFFNWREGYRTCVTACEPGFVIDFETGGCISEADALATAPAAKPSLPWVPLALAGLAVGGLGVWVGSRRR